MKLSDIKINKQIPEDKDFSKKYDEVLRGIRPYYIATIKAAGIKPFSNYKPEPSSAMNIHIFNSLKNNNPTRIHVYQKGDYFIMSDDYTTYYVYLALELEEIPCVVMGDPTGKYVVNKERIELPEKLSLQIVEEPEKN